MHTPKRDNTRTEHPVSPARSRPSRGRRRSAARPRPAFTLTELLVVIAIIVLLVSLIVTGVSVAVESQKRSYTQQIMRSTILAIEQFAEDNPMRLLYDQRDRGTFGPLPPYPLEYDRTVWSSNQPRVPHLIERNESRNPDDLPQERLRFRVARDLVGLSPSQYTSVSGNDTSDNAVLNLDDDPASPAGWDNDNRALALYLQALAPSAFATIPPDAKRPLTYPRNVYPQALSFTETGEFVNTRVAANSLLSPRQARTPVLGIHDAWGVPLDYLIYVKIEYIGDRADDRGFRVVERRPVVRSRGVSREVYDAWLADPTATVLNKPENWYWSEPLPRPWADLTEGDSQVHWHANAPSQANGWARGVASKHLGDYGYLPNRDAPEP